MSSVRGPECATLPNFGEGAFSELADQSAGTAISNTQETSTLQQLLADAELLETLDGEGPFTVFAPRNRAFVDLGDQLSLLAADPDALAATLSYHVIEGEALTSEDLAAEGSAVTLQGEEVTVEVEADVVTFNDGQATAVCGDIPIGNGTLFILDATLVPEEVATAISVPPTTEATATSTPADGGDGQHRADRQLRSRRQHGHDRGGRRTQWHRLPGHAGSGLAGEPDVHAHPVHGGGRSDRHR